MNWRKRLILGFFSGRGGRFGSNGNTPHIEAVECQQPSILFQYSKAERVLTCVRFSFRKMGEAENQPMRKNKLRSKFGQHDVKFVKMDMILPIPASEPPGYQRPGKGSLSTDQNEEVQRVRRTC